MISNGLFDKFFPKIFVYFHNNKSFYKYLTEYGGTFTKIFMITKQGWHELKNKYLQDILY